MVKITAPEQVFEAAAQAKENGFRLSNCFFLPAEIRKKAEEGTLRLQPIPQGLLLLDDQTEFYRCYYYLSESAEYEAITLDKDAVIEFPFRGELAQKQLLQIEKIEALGFCLGRESGMMQASPEMIRSPERAEPLAECVFAAQADAAQVMALFRASFNPLYAFLPTEEELRTAIEEERVFVIRSGSGVAAALLSGFEKSIATMKLVAVAPESRGKHLGGVLVDAFHRYYLGKAASFQHWVDLNNMPAVRMHSSAGYKFTLRKANEYIRLVENKE